ncbi:hypothetical protein JVT61DRAFT_9825 [Boletus reticuloceps]|uniref:Methyltransferase domain-containing protein n=1 Tax=Boletus reticuloceps TaxID=495285 RepID=A0A8I2YFY5_9AGAM|nr:hypothetical protein JVT61DRAFT_9825 [Boletus reticuloceps]
MLPSEDHILREQPRPVANSSLVPDLHVSLKLSEKQTKFLLDAIQDVNPEAIDAKAEIRKRVLEVQDKCVFLATPAICHDIMLLICQIYPYPCIHAFHYISLSIAEHNAFPCVLKANQSSGQANAPLLLDIGCCMGTDLRHLVQSGYLATSVIGCDVRRDFIDLGYELYSDRDRCQISFFVGDVFDITLLPFPQVADDAHPSLKDVQSLNELRGHVNYVYAGSLFHLFDEGTQEAIARRLATLLDVSGGSGPAVLFGKHVAQAEEGVIDDAMGRTRYAHSPASWKELWERVMGDGKIRVHVDAEFRETPNMWNPGRGTELMWWSVWVG